MSEKKVDDHYGRITGMTTAMEYSTSTSGPWTACTATEVAVKPGKYYVRYALTGSTLASSPSEVTVGLTKPTQSDAVQEVPYTGAEQSFVPTEFKNQWTNFNDSWVVVEGTKGTNVTKDGEDPYTATVKPYECWSDGSTDAIQYKWKIVKATPTASNFTITGTSVTYSGADQSSGVSASLSGFAADDRTQAADKCSIDWTGTGNRIDVGSHPFKLVFQGTDNLNGVTLTEGLNLTITQKTPVAADFTVSVYETTYNGGGQTATVILNPTTYTTPQPDDSSISSWLTWTVGGEAEQVNAKEAGYQIVVKINGSQNFANAEAITLTATDNESHHMFIIHKKELADSDVVISGNTATFDAKTHSPTVKINTDTYTTPQPDVSTMSTWLTCTAGDAVSQINAGTYQIKVYVAESSTNFKNPAAAEFLTIDGWESSDKWKLTIAKKELNAGDFNVTYATGETLTYEYKNGAKVNHTPIVEFTNSNFETYYSGSNTGWTSAEKNREWLTWQVGSSGWTDSNKHSQADAGTYAITAAIADNTNFVTNTTGLDIGTMTVQRATLSASDFKITLPSNKTYDGGAIGVTSEKIRLVSGDPSLTGLTWKYFKDSATEGSGSSVSDAGTYQIKLYCTEDTQTNYKVLDGLTADTWKFTINKATLTVVVDPTSCSYTGVYDGTSHPLKVTVSAVQGNSVTLTYNWAQDSSISSLRTGSASISKQESNNQATLTWEAMHVCESGKVTWEAAAGNNYNVYKSTENGKDLTVTITPYQLETQTTDEGRPCITVEKYEGTYDGNPHAFAVDFTLFSADTASKNGIQVTYGMNTTANGEISSIEQKYYTETPVTAYYKLSYLDTNSDFAKYGDYSFEAAQSSTIEIKKLQMQGEIQLDGDIVQDSDTGMTVTIQYNGGSRVLSAAATNLIEPDQAIATYRLGGVEISKENLATALKNMGTYSVEVTVSAESGQDYSDSYEPFVRNVTVVVERAAVEIVDFSYDTVTEGEPMIMTITMSSVGTLDGDIVITYRDQILVTECSIVDNGDGTYTATVVYDTSLGDIPSGTLQTISVAYPGDENHKPSESINQVIRMRSIGMPVIPEEGGDVPIDPEKKRIEVVTPAGDIGFEILDDDDAWEDGSTVIIHVMMRYALEDETIPDADRTIVLETDGYRIHSDGTQTPVKYRVTPSVSVEVPSGKKPVVTLYDTDGSTVGKPDVLTYTSDSATFQTDADGSLSLRIGVTFKSKMIPIPIPDEPVVPVIPETEEKDYTAAVAAACVFVLIAIIVLVMTRRSRD